MNFRSKNGPTLSVWITKKCMGCIICIVCAGVDQLPFAFLGDKLMSPRVGVHMPIVEGGTVDGRNPAPVDK